jgi:MFS family permease
LGFRGGFQFPRGEFLAENNFMNDQNDRKLFWACWIALVTTAFGFIIRSLIMDDLASQFGLSETQKGEIFGVGLWPFAVSIVLFSLVIDRIGYGRAMAFAFICHLASAVVTICAPLVLAEKGADSQSVLAGQRAGYWMLYVGNFIVALGNGTVEAVINPVVATMFSKEKTKWLNILHAGWPGGLVLGGLLTISMAKTGIIGSHFTEPLSWQWKVGLILIPTIAYGIMMLGRSFPINERVAAGVPYKTMLQEVGILGALIVTILMVSEIGRVFEIPDWMRGNIVNFLVLCFGIYVLTFGRPMFIFLLLVMIPLATTELGTDSWITDLLKPVMQGIKWEPGWILVYTSFIMMVLRFFAGPIVHRISPLGLLACSAAIAACGLIALSQAVGWYIFAAATLYGFGKTFFWPTMLGVVSEQFPKGGALTLNATGGVGMLGVGVVGAALLGNIQDRQIYRELGDNNKTVQSAVEGAEQTSIFGKYHAVDQGKVAALPEADQKVVKDVTERAKKGALATVAIFPTIMFVCYVGLIVYFRAKGGYEAQVLTGHAAKDEEFTGGVAGPIEA